MPARLLFVCARGSGRALLAASLVDVQEPAKWEAWCSPPQDKQDVLLATRVLRENGLTPLPVERFIQPTFGMRWDEGIILCSGDTDT